MSKIILAPCGGTGAFVKDYLEAGYDVRNITLPNYDIRTYQPPENVYGVISTPPCTHLAGSGARWWGEKGGEFNIPEKNPVEPTEGSKIHLYPPSKDRAMLRSITPSGFAKAFYKVNK